MSSVHAHMSERNPNDRGKRMKFLIFLAVVLLLYLPNARADCRSECQDEYESEIKSCKDLYDNPEDADELQTCIDSANGDYSSCIDECEDHT